MMQRKSSLQRQFLIRIFLVLIITVVVSGAIQLYLINTQISQETENQAMLIAQSVNNGIEETMAASNSIEHQIDLKLISYSKHIADLLKGKELSAITIDELKNIRDQLGIAGITLLTKRNDDIVGVASTDPEEIGFSMKKVGFYEAGEMLLAGAKPPIPGATFLENNMVVLPIAQSASHGEKNAFYKYAYYHPPGSTYVINPYIEASEVNQFIQKVGPDAWIPKMEQENPYVLEIAVLTPKVFADPTLEQKIYPPLKKVVNGKYDYQSDRDINMLKKMADHPVKETFIQQVNGKKLYKMFLPINKDQVIYTALDYGKISAPLYRHSMFLIIFGLLSLLALFMLTAKFFTGIYKNIQKIIMQIKRLEQGDLTAKSTVSDNGELGDLSHSANKMADALRQLLIDAHEKATKAQRVSVVLEAEANQSVEKAYSLSMETTATARESIEEMNFFLDQVEEQLEAQQENPKVKEILDKMDQMRTLAKERTNNATEITITLSDLFKSLHDQSSELSELSNSLLQHLGKFIL
jgi:HAMP domain-containing protein